MVFLNNFSLALQNFLKFGQIVYCTFKKCFIKQKNGDNQVIFKVKCVESQNISHLESTLLPWQ